MHVELMFGLPSSPPLIWGSTFNAMRVSLIAPDRERDMGGESESGMLAEKLNGVERLLCGVWNSQVRFSSRVLYWSATQGWYWLIQDDSASLSYSCSYMTSDTAGIRAHKWHDYVLCVCVLCAYTFIYVCVCSVTRFHRFTFPAAASLVSILLRQCVRLCTCVLVSLYKNNALTTLRGASFPGGSEGGRTGSKQRGLEGVWRGHTCSTMHITICIRVRNAKSVR